MENLHQKYMILLLIIDLMLRPTVVIAPAHTPFTTFYGLETGLMALEDFKSTRQHDDSLENEWVSLREFEVSKEARIHCGLYLWSKDTYEEDDDSQTFHEWRDDIPRLTDVLPASILNIEFDRTVKMKDFETLVYALDSCKAERLPNLKKVIFHDATAETKTEKLIEKAWKESCKSVGVRLQVEQNVMCECLLNLMG